MGLGLQKEANGAWEALPLAQLSHREGDAGRAWEALPLAQLSHGEGDAGREGPSGGSSPGAGSLGDGQQVAGRVHVQPDAGVLQLHQAAPHLQLLLEGPDELRPDPVHLQAAVLLCTGGRDGGWGRKRASCTGSNATQARVKSMLAQQCRIWPKEGL